MPLGKKIVVLFLVLGVGFSVGSFLVLKLAVFPTFEEFENESMRASISRVNQVIAADLHALEVLNMEYSLWDQTYDYAQGRRPGYAKENLDPTNWQSIDIDAMLIFDASGTLLHGRVQDPTDKRVLSIQQEFLQPLVPGHPLVSHTLPARSVKGLIKTRTGIMQVVSHPILTSAGEGPPAGSFIIGQFLTAERMAQIGKRATVYLRLHSADAANSPPEVIALIQDSLDSPKPMLFAAGEESPSILLASDRNLAHGYQSLRDIFGVPIAVIESYGSRRITRIGADVIRTVTLMLAAASAVFLLAASLFMRRLIVTPVKQLTDQILGIRETGDLQFETSDFRQDEVGVLAGEFKAMTSELSEVQHKLKEARDAALASSKAKSEFLACMSHEIRTPMNGVLGMTELLRDTQLNTKQKRFADTIYDSAEALLRIINDILDFSKIEAGKLHLEPVDVHLRSVVEETVESLAGQAHRKGLELMTMVPPRLDTLVRVDPLRLRQILTNLVGNGIKFTESGEVVVKLNANPTDSGTIRVLFEVRDTGIGIPPDKQDKIFESFSQADGTTTRIYGGTGLGLAICSQLVEQMGGELKVNSRPGKGSVFSFELNLHAANSTTRTAHRQMQHIAGRRVLIVDDNATNREILEHQLSSWRAYADSASSAEQATRLLGTAAARGAPYDLAILDMHMPATDGLDLARAIRSDRNFANLKLVILSSVADPAPEAELQELDIAGQLNKPIRQSQLYDALTIVMGGTSVHHQHAVPNPGATRQLTGRILLAEDNAVNRAVAISMLDALGLEIEVAVNGQEAVEQFSAGSFDAILMDCQMPVMDGLKATEEIRRTERKTKATKTPIIAVTANALTGDRERCLEAGMSDYLTKPFTSEQLHAVLALYLNTQSHGLSASATAPTAAQPGPDSKTATNSVIDSAILQKLTRLQRPGAPDIIQKVISIYIQTSAVIKDTLAEALETANVSQVRESAHALKSSSMNVGAVSFAEFCELLESRGKAGNPDDISTFREQLETEYDRVITALQTQLKAAA